MCDASSTTTRRWSAGTRSSPRACRRPPTESRLACALALVVAACSGASGPAADGAASPEASVVDGRVDLGRVDGLPGPREARVEGAPVDPCAPSTALVARVSTARLGADLAALVGLKERRSQAGQAKAADYLRAQLAALAGIAVRDHSYLYQGKSYANVEVSIAGSEPALPILIAGAHYDSTSPDPLSAPGADDNASGTSALLEAARALAGCRPRRGVRILFFSNEEVGTVGSKEYVKSIKPTLPPAKVLGYLNVDTVAFGPAGEDLDVATKPAQKSFADAMKSAVEAWTSLKVKKVISDHCG
jgi:hypothetical protein